jgi:hypothetical protein
VTKNLQAAEGVELGVRVIGERCFLIGGRFVNEGIILKIVIT